VDKVTARVYSRILGFPIGSRPGRCSQLWTSVANIQPPRPRTYHYAVIDLATKICTPKAPNCPSCPIRRTCKQYRNA
jgi:A/G-specific adenine glycosylase